MNFEFLTIWKYKDIFELKFISINWNISNHGHDQWEVFYKEKSKIWEIYLFGFKIK